MESVEAAQAVLGGTNAHETLILEQQLLAQVVEHKTFEDLTDIISE
jgi:hypothetical protein